MFRSISLMLEIALVLVILRALVDFKFNLPYVCPACGTRLQDEHRPGCPWNRSDDV